MNLICGASQAAIPEAHTMTIELTKPMRVGHTYRKRGGALRLRFPVRSLVD
jgi:hypothetical protein